MRAALVAALALGAAAGLAPAQASAPGISERVEQLEARVSTLETGPGRCIKQAEAVRWQRVQLGKRVVRLLADAPERNGRGRFWLALVHRSCMP